MDSLLIRVLKANTPARRFYEALGGQLVLEEQIEDRGAVLDAGGLWVERCERVAALPLSKTGRPITFSQRLCSEDVTPLAREASLNAHRR